MRRILSLKKVFKVTESHGKTAKKSVSCVIDAEEPKML